MANLAPITLDDGTVIMMEISEINQSEIPSTEQRGRTTRDGMSSTVQRFQAMQGTIKAFAVYTLNSFKQISEANVDKVTLKFGINVGGEAGIPYITQGKVGSNLEITVECSFNKG